MNDHNEWWCGTEGPRGRLPGVYEASYLLTEDESMSPSQIQEGDAKNSIPWLSCVPRKPKPLGCELKTVADGLSGALMTYLTLSSLGLGMTVLLREYP